MRRIFAVAFLAVALGLSGAAEGQGDSAGMQAAANGFYGVYKILGLSDGIPNVAARARYAPFLSPRLDGLLAAADAAQIRFGAKNKDAPPLIEGDLFTSLFEGAGSFKVGVCSGDATSGRCAVALEYDAPKQKPQTWTDNVILVNTPTGWRVDDIGYGGNWDFANSGTLSQTLKDVVAEAR
jgi:hypothetical protein